MRLILPLMFLLGSAGHSFAGKQAFVVGNATYNSLQHLENTTSDAHAYKSAFEKLGYDVSYFEDLGQDAFENAFDVFLSEIQAGDDIAFVFSGHGWSDGQVNYLIPTDAPTGGSNRKLKRSSHALSNGSSGVIDEIKGTGAALVLAIIDACRDNPFEPPKGTKSAGLTRGLARVEAAQETFVIFSAGEGQQALDRLPNDSDSEKLSVFTRNFLPRLTSGMYLEDAISEAQVATAAQARTVNGHLQHPAYYDQTLGKTCISDECGPVKIALARPATANAQCDALYNEAKNLGQCFAYQAFLDTCTDHKFAPFAHSFLTSTCAPETKASLVEPAPVDLSTAGVLDDLDVAGTVRGLLLSDLTGAVRGKLSLKASIEGAVVLGFDNTDPKNLQRFKTGDVIIAVGERSVISFEDARLFVIHERLRGKKSVTLSVLRNGKKLVLDLVL